MLSRMVRDAHVGRIENIDMTRDTALEVDLSYQLPPSTEITINPEAFDSGLREGLTAFFRM